MTVSSGLRRPLRNGGRHAMTTSTGRGRRAPRPRTACTPRDPVWQHGRRGREVAVAYANEYAAEKAASQAAAPEEPPTSGTVAQPSVSPAMEHQHRQRVLGRGEVLNSRRAYGGEEFAPRRLPGQSRERSTSPNVLDDADRGAWPTVSRQLGIGGESPRWADSRMVRTGIEGSDGRTSTMTPPR